MASARARQLTELHKALQVRIGSRAAARLLAVWPLLDPNDLDGTFPVWLAAASPIIAEQHRVSADAAQDYLRAFRTAETGQPGPIRAPDPLDQAKVATSLMVTGPVSVKSAMTRGIPLERAMTVAQAATAAAGERHVLSGGRSTITRTIADDPEAVAFVRITSPGACDYCAALSEVRFTGDASFHAHDGCGCTAEPVYR